MKTFIERTLPLLEPFFIHQDGRTHHPLRHKQPKVVFLSVAGFPEYAVFDPLSSWANFVYGARNGSEKALVAEIYRPMSGFMERNRMPRPDSIEAFTTIMPMGLKSEAAGETRAVVQFNFSGESEGPCHLIIKDGQCEALEGSAKAPQLTIDTPFEVWMDITTGKADGQQMFMEQKYTTPGDLSLLMRMGEFFGNR